jgi:formylglycine-generating enzyme required for sulfatase activity
MKNLKIYMICAFCTAIALTASAESVISDIVVNQRWPWSEKVDVDFVLSGDTNDVEVTATWDGHPAPYRLGTLFAAAPGHNRLTWDPSKSPFAGQTLTGFTVAVSNVAASAHTYLIVDLVNGGYEFLPDVPAGGWAAEHKSSKMVFRRIPAGTYTLGEPLETFSHLGHYSPVSLTTTNCNRRTVTFTSDFYVGIFKYTEAQHACLETGAAGTTYTPQNVSYNALRGAKPAIDWPNTMYRVAEDSVVAKLRAKAGLVVDLCEEEQWEAAARAGTDTFWPTGGTVAESLPTHTNQVNGFIAWYGNGGSASTVVGARTDNGWGLFDVVGLAGEWTLDTARNYGQSSPQLGLPSASTDPTGAEGWPLRIVKSANGNGKNTALYDLLPCRRQMGDPSSGNYSTRFCIHLKPLGSLTFEGE